MHYTICTFSVFKASPNCPVIDWINWAFHLGKWKTFNRFYDFLCLVSHVCRDPEASLSKQVSWEQELFPLHYANLQMLFSLGRSFSMTSQALSCQLKIATGSTEVPVIFARQLLSNRSAAGGTSICRTNLSESSRKGWKEKTRGLCQTWGSSKVLKEVHMV